MKKKKVILWVSVFLTLALIAAVYVRYESKNAKVAYGTALVERGAMAQLVTATGSLNAVVTVQVGSQVSGRIAELRVDFNSPVKEGQIIAQIDPASFQAKVDQARANLSDARAAVNNARANIESVRAEIENARANLQSSKANVERFRVGVEDAKRILNQNKELYEQRLIPQTNRDKAEIDYESALAQLQAAQAQYDSSKAKLNSAHAQLKVAEAQHQAALAKVDQARAALRIADLDLSHTTILSPVDGIVILRDVDVGQTVAASFQAPTLFLIAKDLTKMQVNANVSEADIGKIREGQEATFTVDAYPMTPFKGEVVQVRNSPITIQNVVTYDVVIAVDNPALKLKPGMTANVSIIVDRKEDVLKVPNAALRFQPKNSEKIQILSAQEPGPEVKNRKRNFKESDAPDVSGYQGRRGSVWILSREGKPVLIPVVLGIWDENYTEVISGELNQGERVIVSGNAKEGSRSGSYRRRYGMF